MASMFMHITSHEVLCLNMLIQYLCLFNRLTLQLQLSAYTDLNLLKCWCRDLLSNLTVSCYLQMDSLSTYAVLICPYRTAFSAYSHRYMLTLVLLNQDRHCLDNSVDPDQMASEEAIWSGSTLFFIQFMNWHNKQVYRFFYF